MIEKLRDSGVHTEDRAGRAVALPDSTDGVVAVVNVAREAGRVVAPWWVADSGGVILISLERLASVDEVVPADLMAVVGAGLTCGALNDAVREARLYWPGADVSEPGSMVGDVIARAPGNWTLSGNVLRRYVLGMDAVLADGQVLRTGSRTVKWVTGYDLRQLFMGSRGTLGVVTRLTLRLESLANRDAVRDRYEREFAGLNALGDEPWPAADVLPDAGPVIGSLDVLRLLKAELDPDGVFPAAESAFGAEVGR